MTTFFDLLLFTGFVSMIGAFFYFVPISGRSSYRRDKAMFKAESQASRDAFNESYKSV